MSPDPNDEYFAEGMTEELIATVSKISEISVVSRTSVIQYRKNPKPIRDVAEELKAGTILEGSVRKAGNKVRVTVQLVDAALDKHVWSESYDRGLEDIFAIQSDISQNVAEVLKLRLLAKQVQRLQSIPTRNVDAYTLYLKGRNQLAQRTLQGFQKAIGYFEEAVRRDPKYASAYAGLSDSYALQESWGFMSPREAWPKSLEYATKAIQLDDTLAEAHAAIAGCLTFTKWDWESAEREFRRALQLNPSYADGHHWYAYTLLQLQRRWDEAIQEMREAEKLDPFSPIISVNKARILLWAGMKTEAIEQFRLGVSRNPERPLAHTALGAALIVTSSVDEGIREIERGMKLATGDIWTIWAKAQMAYAYVAANRRNDAEQMLRELKETSSAEYVSGTALAMVYAALGEKDLAFESLNKAVEENTSNIVLLNEPAFDGLRTDPRFHKLLERIGLA